MPTCKELKIAITGPEQNAMLRDASNQHCSAVTFTLADDPCKLKRVLNDENEVIGYNLSLNQYRSIDGLKVRIGVKYQVIRGAPLAWSMSHPTRGFAVTLNYPSSVRVSMMAFGFDEAALDCNDRDCLLTVRYESWLLPNSGVVLLFQQQKAASGAPEPSTSVSLPEPAPATEQEFESHKE